MMVGRGEGGMEMGVADVVLREGVKGWFVGGVGDWETVVWWGWRREGGKEGGG